ncbi:MAG: chromate efflux transporter [Rhodospirillaceae bacterium]|nr:chromate efflux transporter [Rhodospirillaceae bacterium]
MNNTRSVGAPSAAIDAQTARVSFGEAFRVWLKIGLTGFGGPAGQIALMHRILVDEKRWIGEGRFLHALNYCMLLPGPEAQQLAIYVGWLLHGVAGGLVAGILFVLPGAIAILGLSVLYAGFQETTLVQALFFGLKPAVLAIVFDAVLRIGRRSLRNRIMVALAASAFVAVFFLDVSFPLVVAAAAILGYAGSWAGMTAFAAAAGHGPATAVDTLIDGETPEHIRPSLARAIKTAVVCLVLWLGPVAVLNLWLGSENVFALMGVFFSKAAIVTFGGAYSVLAYVAQEAVQTYGWLRSTEMLDGLGLAETTPGPLILVLQFVGFMAAFREAGALDAMVAGVLGAALVTWVTFVPCFLWIFLGAPYVETVRANKKLSAALAAITASVVGVILNLALWFALHVVFAEVAERHVYGVRLLVPAWASVDPAALVLAAGALIAILVFRVGMMPTLAAGAALGLIYKLAAT